jgi:hypothetical protein
VGVALGVWWATAGEPGVGIVRTPLAPVARLLAIVVAALWAVVLLGPVMAKSQLLVIAILIATGVQASVVGLHLRSLAARIPNDSLANHLSNSAFLVSGVCLLMIILHLAQVASTAHLMFFFCAFPMIGGMGLVILWAALTLVRLGLELRQCAVAGQTIVTRQAMRASAANSSRP